MDSFLRRYTLTSEMMTESGNRCAPTAAVPVKWRYSKKTLAQAQLEFPSVNPRVVGGKVSNRAAVRNRR
jgi:hypothetical protein